MSFAELGLIPELLRAIEDQGYTDPTPIQLQAIPVILSGQDVMGGAQTGTGKTAGFTLPLLQHLSRWANTSTSPARHPIRALIIAPTRELAVQVHESVCTYAKYLPIRAACIYGGVDMKAQMAELRAGVEVVVATPGRLLDHVEQRTIQLGQVEILVLDEADRMLDMGFIPDIRRILGLLPHDRQSLLFSATFSEEIKKLADSMLRAPQLIEVARRNTVSETIGHLVHPATTSIKRDLLAHLLKNNDMSQVLVFVSTKFGCSRLARHLEKEGISADAIHGDKSQQQRSEVLEKFKAGELRVLVATDVAARGLDIEDLPYVVNFELPPNPEDYVHRIGRTGRARKLGKAISLVAPEEQQRLSAIEKMIKLQIPREVVPGFGPDAAPTHARSARSERGTRGDGDERSERAERPARTPRRSAQNSSQKNIAADGFDFNRPYESADAGTESGNEKTDNAVLSENAKRENARRAPVAFLLGGNGRN